MTRWTRPSVRGLQPYYNPMVEDRIRMDTSTNVLGSNPAATTLLNSIRDVDLNQYPSTYSDDLRKELAALYGLEPDNFVVGNGSDEILDIIYKTYLSFDENVVLHYPTYSLHDFFAHINGTGVTQVDLDEEFQLDTENMLSKPGKLLVLCTPNNPTGNALRRDDVLHMIESWKGPVLVDEAYGEYAKDAYLPLVTEYDNLIVTRTFSKAYALAGMRVGYCAASEEMADEMMRVKIPYSLNRVSEMCAIAALKDQGFIRRSVDVVDRNRVPLMRGLEELGFEVFPSQSNFIMALSPVPADTLISGLRDKGVLIRDFSTKRRLENCVRTTIGDEELNAILLEKAREVIEECR